MTHQSTSGPDSDDWRGMTPRDRGLSTPMIDDVFALLADWRRRAVCRYFADRDSDAADVGTLAAAVVQRGRERDVVPAETTESAVRDALVEEHLPRLDESGVLDFDARSESVRYWGHATVEKWADHAAQVRHR